MATTQLALKRLALLILIFIPSSQLISYGEAHSIDKITKKITESDLVTVKENLPLQNDIPKNLDEALVELKQSLDPKFIDELKNTPEASLAIRYHFTLGSWMRDNWKLQQSNPLTQFFKTHGVYSPERMSSLVLIAFWRVLNDQLINLEEISSIIYWKKYWDQ